VRKHHKLAVAVLLIGIVSACGGENSGDSSDSTSQIDDVGAVSDNSYSTKVTLKVTGGHSADFEGNHSVRYVLRPATGEKLPFSVASISFPEPIHLGEGWTVQPEVGTSALYKGDGTYEIPAGIGPAPLTGTTVKAPDGLVKASIIQVVFVRMDPPEEKRFRYLAQPCKLTLRDEATKGTILCPSLAGDNGGSVSFSMTWDADEKK
jgi:hypothetical protein